MPTTQAPRPDPLEELLRGALDPDRAAPEAFGEGVRNRIRVLLDEESAELERFEHSSPTLQVAASFLPPMLVPVAAKALGTKTLAAAIKPLGLKALPGLAALPVLSLLMLVVTFFGALRKLRRDTDDAPRESTGTADTVITQWWRRNRRGALISFVVMAILVVTANAEAALFLMGISMLAVTLLLGELARGGFAKRKAVGNWLGFALVQLALNWFMLRDLIPMPASAFANVAAPLCIGCGGIACVWIGAARKERSLSRVRRWIANPIPMNHPDAVTLWTLRIGAGLSVAAVGACFAVAVASMGISAYDTSAYPNESPRALARVLEKFDAPASKIVAWRTFGEQLRSYGATDARKLDLSDARRRLPSELQFTSHVTTALIAAGVTPTDELERLAESGRAMRLVEKPSAASTSAGPELLALAQTGRLSASAHAAAITALIAEFPALPMTSEHGKLVVAREVVFLVEQLGGDAQLDALTPRIHALLAHHWTGEPGIPRASDRFEFAPEEKSFLRRKFDAVAPLDVRTTVAAVDLIDRFGAPEHIDLEQLHLSLVRACKTIPLPYFKRRAGLAQAGLVQLSESRRVPERTFWQRALRERVGVGAVLLSLLAIMAVLRTPREVESDSDGASR